MNDAAWPLRPRAARVFYNLADAWDPDAAGRDAVAELRPVLPEASQRRRAERDLLLLEWSPRLLLASRCGFSWMPRQQRRLWLGRVAKSRLGWIRRRVDRLLALVGQSRAGP
jgi:hypothetical protein